MSIVVGVSRPQGSSGRPIVTCDEPLVADYLEFLAGLSLGRTGTPRLAINSLATQTEKDEQSGLANLVKGMVGMYRNPTAHDPRLRRSISDDELLEVLNLVSMVHRRLDEVRRTERA